MNLIKSQSLRASITIPATVGDHPMNSARRILSAWEETPDADSTEFHLFSLRPTEQEVAGFHEEVREALAALHRANSQLKAANIRAEIGFASEMYYS